MAEFRELCLKHAGKRFCIMGGAPSLAEHVPQIKADVWISTNAHGLDLRPADYLFAMDSEHSGRGGMPMQKFLRQRSDLPIIGPEHWADYRITNWPACPTRILSGMAATWAAWAMGAAVVILAGMDGYNGREGARKGAERIMPFVHCPVRVFGGGWLTRFWPEFDPKEKFGRYVPHSSIGGIRGDDTQQIRVRVNKPTDIHGIERQRGEEFTVLRHEVAFQLKHKLVFEV